MVEIVSPLDKVGLRVLEDWGMMMVDRAENQTQLFETDAPLFAGSADFSGPIKGSICVVAQESFMDVLARNLLGLDQESEVTPEDRSDALKEMVNVLTGNFLTEAYGDDNVFDVHPPEVAQVNIEGAQGLLSKEARRQAYFYSADEQPVALSFTVI